MTIYIALSYSKLSLVNFDYCSAFKKKTPYGVKLPEAICIVVALHYKNLNLPVWCGGGGVSVVVLYLVTQS